MIFDLGYFLVQWTGGFIVPPHKEDDIKDPSNYRGLSLLSSYDKLFKKISNNRLNTLAEKYHVNIEAQTGIRQHMGTAEHFCSALCYYVSVE
jgi:hypothetical protein